MFLSVNIIYLFIKFLFFYSLVRTQIKFEPMKDHFVFLGILYTSGIAFLSYVFLESWQNLSGSLAIADCPDRRRLAVAGVGGGELPALHVLLLADGEV